MQSSTPQCMHRGLGSSHFARRYFGNRCFFLFLALLRCFSSGGSPPYVMCWRMDDKGLPCRVSPFGHPRIFGYLRLPAAFRSLSRPSSAPGAKASTLRSYCLTFWALPIYSVISACFFSLVYRLIHSVCCDEYTLLRAPHSRKAPATRLRGIPLCLVPVTPPDVIRCLQASLHSECRLSAFITDVLSSIFNVFFVLDMVCLMYAVFKVQTVRKSVPYISTADAANN